MMCSSECLSRAAECLKRAQCSSGEDAQETWRRLSDSRTVWAKTVGQLANPNQVVFPQIGVSQSCRALSANFEPPFSLNGSIVSLCTSNQPSTPGPKHRAFAFCAPEGEPPTARAVAQDAVVTPSRDSSYLASVAVGQQRFGLW